MNTSNQAYGIIFIIFLNSCSFNNKNSENLKPSTKFTSIPSTIIIDSTELHKRKIVFIDSFKNSASSKNNINQITPYKNPKTLSDLYSTTFVLDTLFRKTIPNGIGSDDDTYEIIFNSIVGIDMNHKSKWGNITAMDSTSYFDPIFREGNLYYLPFEIDEDCSIILLWEKSTLGFKLKRNYYNLFGNKYGRMKVSDVLTFENNKYLLIELYQPDESGTHSTRINIMKDVGRNSMELIDEFYFDLDSKGDFEECCFLELINSKEIMVKSKIIDLKFQKTIQIN